MENYWVWGGLILGLASSLHCAGMCAPVMVLGTNLYKANRNVKKHALLHQLGRLFSYLSIATIFALFGKTLQLFDFQQQISLVAGIVLLVMLTYPLLTRYIKLPNMKWMNGVLFTPKLWASINKLPMPLRSTGFGILHGLLPCGVVYVAATAAMGMGSLAASLSFMFLFWLGTVPVLVSLSGISQLLKRFKMQSVQTFVTYSIAILFIFRGLGLGIPYISPKKNHKMKTHTEKVEPSAEEQLDCCHTSDK